MSVYPPPICKNIMAQRKLKSMSLDELAKCSGVSKSMLSQIEQDKANPTFITAWKIARALDVTVQDLMDTGSDGIVEVIRKSDANVTYSEDRLCSFRINSPVYLMDNLELYHMMLQPRGKAKSSHHFPNAEEFLTVISGVLRVTSGVNSTILQKGDTARDTRLMWRI